MANQFSALTREELLVIKQAADSLGMDSSRLQAGNPWEFGGTPQSLGIQMAVARISPAIAQGLQEKAQVPLSLGAQAFVDGIDERPASDAVAREVEIKRPIFWAEYAEAQKAATWAKFEETRAAQVEAKAAMQAQHKANESENYFRSLEIARNSLRGNGLAS